MTIFILTLVIRLAINAISCF